MDINLTPAPSYIESLESMLYELDGMLGHTEADKPRWIETLGIRPDELEEFDRWWITHHEKKEN